VLFHGAALGGLEMSEVCAAVDRREPEALQAVLAEGGSSVAIDVLTGILETDAREQSGIWSTASGVLRAYRTVAARASAVGEPLPVEELAAGRGTLFVVAGTDQQEHVAPVIAGLVRDLRSAVYEHHRREPYGPPLLLVLDELAHIAPLHDLPALVAEGASQGLLTLACLQDLSQARRRWGQAAEGFFSLFGTKIVLGGVGDRGTLETLSMLAGEREVAVRSSTRSASYFGRGRPLQRSRTTRREPRLSPADAAAPGPGTAWCVTGTTIGRVALRPVLSREAPGR
jgi:type IV secretory pathway TraG/TraD family ATPase VirD4